MKVLFSPVGGTDPISEKNLHEGALLHITRHYKPDKIIMYMSKEISEKQHKDERYTYCLEKLAEQQERRIDYKIISNETLENVQDFNLFFKEFKDLIEALIDDLAPEDELFLNVSSGTPAMKNAIVVLQTLGEYNTRLIQVDTPTKRMNEHEHKNNDIELLWELNEDNAPEAQNRCREIVCPNLSIIKYEGIIEKHIRSYDYSAACEVAKTLPAEVTSSYIDLIKMAKARLLLDYREVDNICEQNKCQCIPVKSTQYRKLVEYALSLDIKHRREEYADFVRAITPLLLPMFRMILEKRCHIKLSDYLKSNTKNGDEWDLKKIKKNDTLFKIFEEKYPGGLQEKKVYTDAIAILIEKISNETGISNEMRNLREIEKEIRNVAAHEIISVTDEVLVKKTGYTAKEIMNKIKKLFDYASIPMSDEDWQSYDKMNDFIIDKMKNKLH